MTRPTISEAEWQVMQIVWSRRSVTAADVIMALEPTTGWSHRTIRTLLARLVEKSVLKAEPDGNRYNYRPLVTRSKCVREAGRSFLDRVFDGNASELLVHFVRHGKITAQQIQELKNLLDERQDKET